MEVGLDELIKRIFTWYDDMATDEQYLTLYRRLFPERKEANVYEQNRDKCTS